MPSSFPNFNYLVFVLQFCSDAVLVSPSAIFRTYPAIFKHYSHERKVEILQCRWKSSLLFAAETSQALQLPLNWLRKNESSYDSYTEIDVPWSRNIISSVGKFRQSEKPFANLILSGNNSKSLNDDKIIVSKHSVAVL